MIIQEVDPIGISRQNRGQRAHVLHMHSLELGCTLAENDRSFNYAGATLRTSTGRTC